MEPRKLICLRVWTACLAFAVSGFAQVSNPPLQVQLATVPQGAAIKMNFSTGTSVSCAGGLCTVTATGAGGQGGVYTAVSFSATPTFTATSNTDNSFSITLTGNVTSSTLASSAAGQILNFKICQDPAGSRTFAWPTGFSTAATISPTASSCTKQSFFWDGSNAQPTAPATVDSGPGYVGLQTAPSGNPVAGFVKSWCDSTDLDCEILNSAGSTFAMALKGGDYNPVTGVVSKINGGAVNCAVTGGVYYQNGTAGQLTCASSFTYNSNLLDLIGPGGSNGQAAASGSVAVLDNVGNSYIDIISGTGSFAGMLVGMNGNPAQASIQYSMVSNFWQYNVGGANGSRLGYLGVWHVPQTTGEYCFDGATFGTCATSLSQISAGITGFGTGAAGSVAGGFQATSRGTIAVLTANLPACSAAGSTPTGINSYDGAVSNALAPTLGAALTGGGTVWVHVHCSLTTGTYIVDGL